MRARLRAFVELLTGSRTHPHTVRLFRRVIYGWYMIWTITLLPAARQFWGPDSLIERMPRHEFPFLQLLDLDAVRPWFPLLVAAQLVLLLIGMTCRWPRTIALSIYIVAMNLDNRAWAVLDGGNNLMQLMLIYLIFMDPSPADAAPPRSDVLRWLSNALTNAAFLLARLQVVAVYLVAGLGKVDGELWQNGTAIYYTLSVDDFTMPWVRAFVARAPLFSVVATYVTLVYQISFPWLIWNRRFRPWLMLVGTAIHLQISLIMGLFTFGLAVMASYVSFFPDARSAAILERTRSWARRRWIPASRLNSAPGTPELQARRPGSHGALSARRSQRGLGKGDGLESPSLQGETATRP